MTVGLHSTGEFYATACGGMAARLLRERLALLWPDLHGQSVLGLGYAAPYLRLWRGTAARCVAASPARIEAVAWPAGAPCRSCAVEEDALPFPDLCFDRVLLVHGLEASGNARRMLREVWRVLKDDGRLLAVTPNRSGLWAHVEGTPFGQGRPYSPRQVELLLRSGLFRVERCDTALYLPPTQVRVLLRGARLWETSGRQVAPQLAGLTITEAAKDMFAAVPLGEVRRRRRVVLRETA